MSDASTDGACQTLAWRLPRAALKADGRDASMGLPFLQGGGRRARARAGAPLGDTPREAGGEEE